MRILLATDHYPPWIGGAQRQAQLLAEGMVSRGHEVAVVTPWSGGLPRRADEHGVAVHRVRQLRTAVPSLVRNRRQRHATPFPDPVTTLDLRRLIRETEPDLIHSYGWLTFSVVAAMGRRRIPLMLTARDYAPFCARRTLMHNGETLCEGPALAKCMACSAGYYGIPKGWTAALGVLMSRRMLVRKVTAIHGVSRFVTAAHGEHLLDALHSGDRRPLEITLPNMQAPLRGEDTSPRNPVVAEYLERLPKEPFIMFVGAFRKVKGLETIFAAYRRLSSPPPLVLMGTFEVDSPGGFPDDAIVLEDVPHAAVMAAWERALFGVMPSTWPEPFAGTIHEAMGRGNAVISTTIGGSPDMIDETNGILVPPGDEVALAEAMEELISDPARREAYGRAGVERARSLKPDVVLPRYEETYRAVIAAAARDG